MARPAILVVEDEKIVALDIKQRLEGLGYVVPAIASTGKGAIQYAEDVQPDLVFMDIRLAGEMDGIEAAAQIQSRFDIPVVFLTALTDDPTLQRATKMGPLGYLVKPFQDRDLRSAIEVALQSHELQRKLRESEARYRGLFEGTPIGLYRTTPDGLLIDANPALIDMLGFPDLESLSGVNADQIWLDPEDRKRWQDALATEGVVRGFRAQLRRRDDTPILVRDTARVVCDAEGRVLYYEGALEDITVHSQAEEALRQHSQDMSVLNEMSHRVSTTLSLDDVAQAALSGIVECVGPDIAILHLREGDDLLLQGAHTEDPALVHNSPSAKRVGECLCGLAAERGEPVYSGDIRSDPACTLNECKDAGMRSVAALPVLRGSETMGVLTVASVLEQDYSDRHAFWQALAGEIAIGLQNALLYQEVRDHAEQLIRALGQLQELDHLKSELIQNISHELRLPLAIIRGYAELLNAGELGELAPEFQGPIEIITRRTKMLGNLVEDITLILEMETRPLQLMEVALGDLAGEAVADFRGVAEQAGLSLQAEIPPDLPSVEGEPNCIRRVLDHLLDNAVKFTPSGGTVSVRAWQENNRIELEVKDTGIGIPPDEQERVFDLFYQIDGSSRRRFGGTGLGLALVKEVVESLGGGIRLESVSGKGSTFTLTLVVSEG